MLYNGEEISPRYLPNRRLLTEGRRTSRKLALKHYENFVIASFFLPRQWRQDLFNIYAFARIADDVVDEDFNGSSRLERLEAFERQLDLAAQQNATEPLFVALGDTINKHNLPLILFKRLLNAFRLDLTKNRYTDWEELEQYAVDSANPIGRLVLMIAGETKDEFFALSDKICTALQFTNHWQDIVPDYRRGRIYIPQNLMFEYKVTEQDIASQRFTPQVKNLMEYLVKTTEKIFSEGKPLLDIVKKPLRAQLYLYWQGGVAALNEIKKVNYNVLNHHPKVNFSTKMRLLLNAWVYKYS